MQENGYKSEATLTTEGVPDQRGLQMETLSQIIKMHTYTQACKIGKSAQEKKLSTQAG